MTLTGTTDGSEASAVARQRAEAVARYLTEVWGIGADRIAVQSRGLPEKPSGSRTPEGREENRRVEITSNNPALLAPLQIEEVQQVLKPPFVRFHPSITATAGLNRWRFEVRHGNTILRENEGLSSYPDSITWNWRGLDGALPVVESPLRFTLYARDTDGSEVTTAPQEIPVSLVTLERKQLEQLPDRTIEKISLILFDFDRSDLGSQNLQLLDLAAERLTERSSVLIRGYTDRMGADDYNLALSQRRSSAVRDALSPRLQGRSIRAEGVGETSLLYDNDLPEGRFYCRTVQILVETIK
jgi:outer membrane protein OmpA-like peptidoglycan-associated protein